MKSNENQSLETRTKKFLFKESLIGLHEQSIQVNHCLGLASCELDKVRNKIESMSDRLHSDIYTKTLKKELDRNIISIEMAIAVLNSYTTAFRTLAKQILNKKEV